MAKRQVIEHPILFSEIMLRAILSKKKSMTRRVLSERDYRSWASTKWAKDVGGWPLVAGDGRDLERMRCPYGGTGDLLWVKHTFFRYEPPSTNPANEQAWDEVTKCARWPSGERVRDCTPELGSRWSRRPSIFMPRWASMVLLKVTAVRCEKLKQITDRDVVAEGVAAGGRDAFKKLWNSINEERGYGWGIDPYVWVVSFKVVKK